MPDTAVIEQPPTVAPDYVPPQASEPKPLKVKAGDIFKREFEKLTKAEAEGKPPEADKPVEPPKEELKEEVKPEVNVESKQAEKPASPLDVVTADQKPEEAKVEEPDILKEFDEKTANWKRAREVMKAQSEEKKALEAKVAELAKTPKSDPEEIAKLSQERDALKQSLAEREELIKSVDVRLSTEYQSTLHKRDAKIAKVSKKADAYGANAEAIISAMALPDSKFKNEQIKAAMADLDGDDKAELKILMGEVDGLNEQLQEFEKDAPKKYEELQSRREAQLREQQENHLRTIQSEFVKLAERLPQDIVTLREVPDDVPGGTEWNKAIRDAKEKALQVLTPGGSDYDESATIAFKGAHYNSLMGMFLKDHSELVSARKRLAEFDAGGPDFKGGDKPKSEPKLTASEKFHKALETLKSNPTE